MITKFIKKKKVIAIINEGEAFEDIKEIFEKLDKETVKSLELVFEKGTSLDDVSDVFMHQSDKCVKIQNVYLDDY